MVKKIIEFFETVLGADYNVLFLVLVFLLGGVYALINANSFADTSLNLIFGTVSIVVSIIILIKAYQNRKKF